MKFGPDGAMYIVDYGIVEIDMAKKPPYLYRAQTGAIWKVTRAGVDAMPRTGGGGHSATRGTTVLVLPLAALGLAALLGSGLTLARRRSRQP